jgi:lipoprotein NlpI
MNDPDGAIAQFERAIEIDSANADAHAGLGEALRDKGRMEDARAAYDLARELEPEIAAGYRNGGTQAFSEALYRDAVSNLARSVHLRPGDPYTVLWLYLARARLGNQDAATELAANAAKLQSPDWPYPVVDLFLGKATPQATLDAPTNSDDRCEAQFYVGEWLALQGDADAAHGRFKQAVDTCKNSFIEYKGARAELKRLDRRTAVDAR